MIIGYALGNSVGPQPWKKIYQPRNHVPWTVIAVAWAMAGLLMLTLRWYMKRENTLRDAERSMKDAAGGDGPKGDDASEEVYVEGKEGVYGKVDKVRIPLSSLGPIAHCTTAGLLGPHRH